MKIQKAVRKKVKFLGCLYGYSGSGKTYSALRLAKGLGKKIGLIDTENERALLYGDEFDFEHIALVPPFSPERIYEAVELCVENNCDVIIIDSISHEWMGLGGCIDIAENATTSKGTPRKGLDKWNKPIMRHRKLINKLLQVKKHIIFCARAKKCYEQDKYGNVSEKGTFLVQHKEFNHEMILTFYMDNKLPFIKKCPKKLLDNLKIKEKEVLTEKHGETIAKWLDGGVDIDDLNIDDLKEDMLGVAKNQGTKQLESWFLNKSKKERDLLKEHDKLKPFFKEFKQKAIEFDNKGSKTSGLEQANEELKNE